MRRGFLITLEAVAIAAGVAGCGSPGPHSGNWLGSSRSPVISDGSVELKIESRPTGAMISVNGAQVGTTPILLRFDVDPAGKLVTGVEISADYAVINPVRGVASIVSVKFRRGDSPPKQLMLARPAEGGIQSLGGFVPGM